MNNLIKRIPLPISGLALGIAAMQNLLVSHSPILKDICFILASFLILLIIIKIVTNFSNVKEQLNNMVVASVFVTFFMTIALLAPTYKEMLQPLGYFLWYFALIGHLLYLIYFTKKFVVSNKIANALPTWFIVYVGYVVCANTSPAFGYQSVGKILVWLGFIMFVILFGVITYRFKINDKLPEPVLPTIAIYTAPLNLCIVGYLTLFEAKSSVFLIICSIISIVIFIGVLILLPKIIINGFYPSYSALTFPFVISTLAYKQLAVFFNLNIPIVINILELFVIIIVLYVLFKYITFLTKKAA